ncbi:hypothetical protein [Halarchaeum sp. P4]|uniref:hypothetical protein n=1 Tax=Halarchaeum sp. P4 TaxID=3421639 RepID=UPI003EB7F8E3
MNREDLAGLLAALGICLLLFGVGGSATIDTPMVGELLGLSTTQSLRLAGAGMALLVGVAVVGTLLKRSER